VKTGRLIFAADAQYANLASTELRGRQLALIAPTSAGLSDWSVDFVIGHDFEDSIVVLTKGFLAAASLELLDTMKQRANVLIGDFVDLKPDGTVVELLDGLIASSHRQLDHFRSAFPQKPCHMVTHHVDLRIDAATPPVDMLRVGYFGELFNARHRPELAGAVDFIETNTRQPDPAWMARLPFYNCHYIVRAEQAAEQAYEGFKPFTKGFVAAHCNAPVIARRSEGDAPFYLPEDYPYFVEEPASPEQIIEMIDMMKHSFQGPQWNSACAAMREIRERSSALTVAHEIYTMISLYRGT
jgi:hypothetical protein